MSSPEGRKTKGKNMARGTDTYTELDEIDVDETDLDAEETVELGGDVDAWMADMLAGPSDPYSY